MSGIVRSSQKVIGLTGSDSAAAGSFFSSRQRLTKRWRGERARSSLKSDTVAGEVADAARRPCAAPSACSGSFAERVVQRHEQAARIGHRTRHATASGSPVALVRRAVATAIDPVA
ncbi:MAG: hypothetical protein V9G29_11545 [Burkholderiaceae bacterium]